MLPRKPLRLSPYFRPAAQGPPVHRLRVPLVQQDLRRDVLRRATERVGARSGLHNLREAEVRELRVAVGTSRATQSRRLSEAKGLSKMFSGFKSRWMMFLPPNSTSTRQHSLKANTMMTHPKAVSNGLESHSQAVSMQFQPLNG